MPARRIGSSGASGRVIFKFRARLWTGSILDVRKKLHSTKSVARIQLISFFFVLFSKTAVQEDIAHFVVRDGL